MVLLEIQPRAGLSVLLSSMTQFHEFLCILALLYSFDIVYQFSYRGWNRFLFNTFLRIG